jgi:hypothetical protein
VSSRTERRLNRKSWGKGIIDHPSMRRMSRNAKRAGRAAFEVYRIDGDLPKQHAYFDVFSMREWAEKQVVRVVTLLDWERAARLIQSGVVDKARIADHTLQTDIRPVIIGRDAAGPGDDQLLDGAHTYVAVALAATASGQQGQPTPLHAYILEPTQWRQFLIPNHVAKALNFDATIDSDDRTWASSAADWESHLSG